MSEDLPLTHDQIIARVQAFYSHLRKNFEELKLARQCPCGDVQTKKVIQAEFEAASDLLDLYSHTFDGIIYTWIE